MEHGSQGNDPPPQRRGPSVELDPSGTLTGKGPDRSRHQFLNYAFYRLDPVFRRRPVEEQLRRFMGSGGRQFPHYKYA